MTLTRKIALTLIGGLTLSLGQSQAQSHTGALRVIQITCLDEGCSAATIEQEKGQEKSFPMDIRCVDVYPNCHPLSKRIIYSWASIDDPDTRQAYRGYKAPIAVVDDDNGTTCVYDVLPPR